MQAENIFGGNDPQPSRFVPIDDFSTDITFFETKGEFPWNSGEPNNARLAEDCVEYELASDC